MNKSQVRWFQMTLKSILNNNHRHCKDLRKQRRILDPFINLFMAHLLFQAKWSLSISIIISIQLHRSFIIARVTRLAIGSKRWCWKQPLSRWKACYEMVEIHMRPTLVRCIIVVYSTKLAKVSRLVKAYTWQVSKEAQLSVEAEAKYLASVDTRHHYELWIM